MNLYERLNLLCTQRGTTITNVIKELGLSTSLPTNWKKGIMPNAETIIKLSDYFNVSVDYLYGRTDVPQVFKKQPIKSYKNFIDACNRKKVSPEKVFQELNLPLSILENWENGIAPKDEYVEFNLRDVLWRLANYFDENHVWGKENPFVEHQDIFVPPEYASVMVAFAGGTEDLTQEDIDSIVEFIEFKKNQRKK